VTFAEKIERWTAENQRSRAQLAKNADLEPSVLHNYIKRDSAPMAVTALRLARAMKVPVEWLIDDAQDEWPPPDSEKRGGGIANASDREIMIEAARRYRRAVIDYISAQDAADKFDWKAAADELEKLAPGEPLPAALERAQYIWDTLNLSYVRAQNDYDLAEICAMEHQSLPGGNRPLAELSDAEGGGTFREFTFRVDFDRFHELLAARPEYERSPAVRAAKQYNARLERYLEMQQAGHVSPPRWRARVADVSSGAKVTDATVKAGGGEKIKDGTLKPKAVGSRPQKRSHKREA
jgi:hypothetical protein